MTIINIVDDRTNQYCFRKINAVVEATWHDNKCQGADQIAEDSLSPSYRDMEHVSVTSAIAWAATFEGNVTLYLYDEDDGIYPVRVDEAPQEREDDNG